MIIRIRHRGLRRLHEEGDGSGVDAAWVGRLADILRRLDGATGPADVRLQVHGLHALHGDLRGFYALKVTRNWRVIFRFEGEHATDVQLLDYH